MVTNTYIITFTQSEDIKDKVTELKYKPCYSCVTAEEAIYQAEMMEYLEGVRVYRVHELENDGTLKRIA